MLFLLLTAPQMVTPAPPAHPARTAKTQKPVMFGPCTHTLNRGREPKGTGSADDKGPCHGVALGSGDLICMYCGQWMGYAFIRPLPILPVLPVTRPGVATQVKAVSRNDRGGHQKTLRRRSDRSLQ